MKIVLLSTVLLPAALSFDKIDIACCQLTKDQFLLLAPAVSENYHGHLLTVDCINNEIRAGKVPDAVPGKFWQGDGSLCLVARPIGGVRGGADIAVTIDSLEFWAFTVSPGMNEDGDGETEYSPSIRLGFKLKRAFDEAAGLIEGKFPKWLPDLAIPIYQGLGGSVVREGESLWINRYGDGIAEYKERHCSGYDGYSKV